MEALKGKNMGGRALNIGKWLKRLTILQSGASSQRTSMPLKAPVHLKIEEIVEDAPGPDPEIEVEEEIEETEETEVEAKRGGEIDLIQGPNHAPDLTRLVIVMAKKRKSVHTMMTEVEITAETAAETAVAIEIAAEEAAIEIVEIAETVNAMIVGVEEVVLHIKRVRSVKEVLVAKARKGIKDPIVLKRAQRNLPMPWSNRNSFRISK